MLARDLVRKVARDGINRGKQQLGKFPRLEAAVHRVILKQASLIRAENESTYTSWLRHHVPDAVTLLEQRDRSATFAYRPLISVVVPVYNPDIAFLVECINSVRTQSYDNWQLCLVDDASPDEQVRATILAYAARDPRIQYRFLDHNTHISAASNAGVELSSGDFIVLLDHDDMLWPNALFEVASALDTNPDLDFIYSDEDKITDQRSQHDTPHFKPDWNPDLLRSVNYITHMAAIRTSVIEQVGGFRSETNGAQDWDLFLRVTDATDRIHHIPTVLYSWRRHQQSTASGNAAKPYVVQAQRRTLLDALAREGRTDATVTQDPRHPYFWNVAYPVQGHPLVSIVIPSKNQFAVVKRCIESIYERSSYTNFEIVLVDTGSDDKRVLRWYEELAASHANFRLVSWPEQPFSYSRSCNEGARQARGEFLIMLNNDTEVITGNWIEILIAEAQRPGIGSVGCLLYYPDHKHIQHAGVVISVRGIAANTFSRMLMGSEKTVAQQIMLHTRHDLTAVTAACLAIRKDIFEQMHGFDPEFRVTFNDVDLCLRLCEAGYRNMWTPYVELLHHESISIGRGEKDHRDLTEFDAAKDLFQARWPKYLAHDPHFNPNFTRENSYYEVENPDRLAQVAARKAAEEEWLRTHPKDADAASSRWWTFPGRRKA